MFRGKYEAFYSEQKRSIVFDNNCYIRTVKKSLMRKGFISVVIPCYNHGKYLNATVESVLQSDYQDVEVIIVNDGSSDNSEAVALRLAHFNGKIRYIFEENQGPAVARNRGIREATGEYILPLDADDLISPHYISEAINELQDESVKLVYCNAEFIDGKTGPWILKPFSLRLLARDNMIFCSGIFRKADWEKAGGYDEKMVWGREDWEFWISLLKSGGKVVKLAQTGFYYRIHAGSRRKKMTSERKRKIVNYINKKHRKFIYAQLNGPLRIPRTWSRLINTIVGGYRV